LFFLATPTALANAATANIQKIDLKTFLIFLSGLCG
jgi:hypothetical protein